MSGRRVLGWLGSVEGARLLEGRLLILGRTASPARVGIPLPGSGLCEVGWASTRRSVVNGSLKLLRSQVESSRASLLGVQRFPPSSAANRRIGHLSSDLFEDALPEVDATRRPKSKTVEPCCGGLTQLPILVFRARAATPCIFPPLTQSGVRRTVGLGRCRILTPTKFGGCRMGL
jgi:hypothetical protein